MIGNIVHRDYYMENFDWQLAILTSGVFGNAALVMIFYHLKKNVMAFLLGIPLLYWGANWINYVVNHIG